MDDGEEASLRELIDVLIGGWKLVLAAVVGALVVGVGYALVAAPVYRSDALVQVEPKKGGMGPLDDLSGLLGDSTPAETEIEILRSRSLVGAVVDELRLDVVAEPRRFPLLGGAMARRYHGEGPAPAGFGLGRYGWGGEKLVLGDLVVPPAPAGEDTELVLVAGEGGRFELRDDGEKVLEGTVGAPAEARGIRIFVAGLTARPGTEFTLRKLDRDEVVEDLQKDLRIAEKGKKTGILSIELDGKDPARVAATLDALANAYLRQNVERKSAEAAKTLAFLQSQLPELKARLDTAEADLEAYRAKRGSVDVTIEAKGAIDRAAEVEKAIGELRAQDAELRQRFTENHPVIAGLRDKLARLEQERAAVEARFRKLPESELQSARRLRDVKVANELYLALLNRAQELQVVKEGTIGNVRILDGAVVRGKPVAPKRVQVVLLSLLLGLAAGVGLVFATRALDHGIEDPDDLERSTGLAVYASVPHSAAQTEASLAGVGTPLALAQPKDLAVEALRSLRTSLRFTLMEAPNRRIVVGGPAPATGKSFVVVNLACLLGDDGKKVVVVDADLRRGHLHRFLGGARGPGLAEVLTGQVELDAALRTTPSPGVTLLATGALPPNPAELAGSERFERVIQELETRFDVVLIDTPPVLAVADGLHAARTAGVNLLVLRAGKHPLREVTDTLRRMETSGVAVHGFVLNDVQLERGLGRKNLYYYQYKYE